MFGEQDNDDLRGQAGNDRLFGGQGFDGLRGGPGEDRVRGGPGADDVIYTNLNHIAGDRLPAYDARNGMDQINLFLIDADLNDPDNDIFTPAGPSPTGEVSNAGEVDDGEVGLRQIGNDVRVFVNQGGGPTVSLLVEDVGIGSNPLANVLSASSDDFSL